ncbi:hypothetical protein BaRGS_00021642 [Batillaria attramentaria]|uniref:Uncharacterized protein n=1 Tax=Batillaria attramentaria TaxID=370345 RepID=A0ABD0KJH5_9CAEN
MAVVKALTWSASELADPAAPIQPLPPRKPPVPHPDRCSLGVARAPGPGMGRGAGSVDDETDAACEERP